LSTFFLKQQTAAGRVFRAAEYEVGVAQARALGTPDRCDTVSISLPKQQTAAGRVFRRQTRSGSRISPTNARSMRASSPRAAEYEVGVAQARALSTPDRYDTVSTFLLKYLKFRLDFSAQILLDFFAQILLDFFCSNTSQLFCSNIFKSLLEFSAQIFQIFSTFLSTLRQICIAWWSGTERQTSRAQRTLQSQ
jgi:hypothetical protein